MATVPREVLALYALLQAFYLKLTLLQNESNCGHVISFCSSTIRFHSHQLSVMDQRFTSVKQDLEYCKLDQSADAYDKHWN